MALAPRTVEVLKCVCALAAQTPKLEGPARKGPRVRMCPRDMRPRLSTQVGVRKKGNSQQQSKSALSVGQLILVLWSAIVGEHRPLKMCQTDYSMHTCETSTRHMPHTCSPC